MEISAELIVFIGVFLGCLIRTVLPYIKKERELAEQGKTLKFDYKFALTGILAFLESVTVALTLFTKVPVDVTLSPFYLFVSSFTFAYTSNDIINTAV